MDNTPLTAAELAEMKRNQEILRNAVAKHGLDKVTEAVKEGMRRERESR